MDIMEIDLDAPAFLVESQFLANWFLLALPSDARLHCQCMQHETYFSECSQ